MKGRRRKTPRGPRRRWLDIPLDLYRLHVIVAWEMTKEELMRLARRSHVEITEEKWGKDFAAHADDPRCSGLCMEFGDDKTDLLVWLRTRPQKASELAHELYHATQGVIRARNLHDEKESPAFILEYLTDQCQRVFWPRARRSR